MLTEMFMKGHEKTIRLIEKEWSNFKTEQIVMECGSRIISIGNGGKDGQIVLNILVFMLWAKYKAKGYFIGKMEVNMKANISKIIWKGKVYMNGLMAKNIMVTGKIIKWMGKENIRKFIFFLIFLVGLIEKKNIG